MVMMWSVYKFSTLLDMRLLPAGRKSTPTLAFLPGAAIRLYRAPPYRGGPAVKDGERILKANWGDASHPVIECISDNRVRLNSQQRRYLRNVPRHLRIDADREGIVWLVFHVVDSLTFATRNYST
jgi:hypothetical protein